MFNRVMRHIDIIKHVQTILHVSMCESVAERGRDREREREREREKYIMIMYVKCDNVYKLYHVSVRCNQRF